MLPVSYVSAQRQLRIFKSPPAYTTPRTSTDSVCRTPFLSDRFLFTSHLTTFRMSARCIASSSVSRGLAARPASTAQRCVAVRAEPEEPRTTNDTVFYGGNNYTEAEVCLPWSHET